MRHSNFFDEIHDFQRFVRENIKLLGDFTIISEQLRVSNNVTGILDFLLIDNKEKRIVITELKNTLITDKQIWQPIRYFDLISRGEDSLKDLIILQKHKLEFPIEEINFEPRVMLVAPQYNEQLLRTISHFANIDINLVVLNRFVKNNQTIVNKEIYYPTSITHKENLSKINNKIHESWDLQKYKNYGVNLNKIRLAEDLIKKARVILNNFNNKVDVFYDEKKIVITKNGKVLMHLFIKNKMLDYKLTFTLKTSKNTVTNINDFSYNTSISHFEIQKNGIKITLNDFISVDFLEKYLRG